MIAIGMLTDDPPTIYDLIHFSSGILKLICRLWIVHIVSAKPNRFTCSGSLLRAVSKSVCWNVPRRNYDWINLLFNRVDNKLLKVNTSSRGSSQIASQPTQLLLTAANKEELLEMITHGAEKIINSTDS